MQVDGQTQSKAEALSYFLAVKYFPISIKVYCRIEEFFDEAESNEKGLFVFNGQCLCEKQCPIIVYLLVTAHPVNNRPGFTRSVF